VSTALRHSIGHGLDEPPFAAETSLHPFGWLLRGVSMAAPPITGVHHVKFPVSNLQQSRDWYVRVLGLQVLVDFPDEDGVVRGLAGLLPGPPPVAVALREHPTAAAGAAGFDPVSFAIADRDAALAWAAHLDQLGVEHSGVTEGTLGWTLDIPDPDGIIVRLYSADRTEVDHTNQPGYARAATAGVEP
jgi:catechol 2,3-dioxygenase-like lactoylglutathione lyase family enzyme